MKISQKMRLIGFLITLLILIILPIGNSFAEDHNFRKTRWGMSLEEVKNSERLKKLSETEDNLMYQTTVMGRKVLVIYLFVHNRLARTMYALAETHINPNDFITDYKRFKEILTKKYGASKRDKMIWKDDLFKEDPSKWGVAISMGHLMYIALWDLPDTEIDIFLLGKNFKTNCVITYTSKLLKEALEKMQTQKAQEAF